MSFKLLVAVGEAVAATEELPNTIRLLVDAADEIYVVSPTLPGGLQWLVSDTDKARAEADERLGNVLGQLEQIGAGATGAVGSDEPVSALEDAARTFEPDHILIALRSAGSRDWQERGLLERVIERLGKPLTVFQIVD
jgi:hypothetical protein